METIHLHEQIALKWLKAFNEKKLDDLLSLYDADAVHYSPKLKIKKPETNGFINGKVALRQWWNEAFDSLPTLYYQLTSLTANDKSVFMEYVRKVTGEEDILVAEVLDIKGLIIASRVYHG